MINASKKYMTGITVSTTSIILPCCIGGILFWQSNFWYQPCKIMRTTIVYETNNAGCIKNGKGDFILTKLLSWKNDQLAKEITSWSLSCRRKYHADSNALINRQKITSKWRIELIENWLRPFLAHFGFKNGVYFCCNVYCHIFIKKLPHFAERSCLCFIKADYSQHWTSFHW